MTELAPHLEKLFFTPAWEGQERITGITGHIPAWLRGSYYLNGPARFERNGMRAKHWLDGDGMIRALHFRDDGVEFVARFLQTPKLKAEEQADRFLFRGFGTAFPGDQLRHGLMLEPPVNVSIYPWADKVLAFGEQSQPLEIDPWTLETKGDFDFQGGINAVTPFAAHAKVFAEPTPRMANFGVSFSAQPQLNLYEFDEAGALIKRRRHSLKHQFSLHDFGLTKDWAVFFLGPLIMDFGKFVKEGVSVMESLMWKPELGTTLLFAPRAGNTAPAFEVPAGNAYGLHIINCFEKDGRLIVDLLELDEPVYREYQVLPDVFSTITPARPVRFVIDAATHALLDRIEMDYTLTPDFPAVEPTLFGHEYDDFWMLGMSQAATPGRKFFDELVHARWSAGASDFYRLPKGEYFGGEPAFVSPDGVAPGVSSPEGAVIVQHFAPATGTCEFWLFDARDVRKGPIARLPLQHSTPPGFHACYRH